MKNFSYVFLLIKFLLMLLAFLPNVTQAAIFVVNTTNDTQDEAPGNGVCADSSGNCSLRAAITEANALAGGDTITLPAGTYTITLTGPSENANASGDFDLNSEITINGAGAANTIVQAAASRGVATERVFHLLTANAVNINNLTIRYGRTTAGAFGAGVRVDVAAVIATLNNVVVTENDSVTSGGGISVSGAPNAVLTLNNCIVSDNTAGGTGASTSVGAGIQGNVTTATINVNNSTIIRNSVSNTSASIPVAGGGVLSLGTLNITGSTVENNTASSSGQNAFSGGVAVVNGTATITASTIRGNITRITGGTGSALVAGVYNQNGTVSITNSLISENVVTNSVTPANAFHAGVRTLATTFATTTNITNTIVMNNTANSEGGGVVNISAGTANSITNITSSTLSGNQATGATSLGGGLENFNTSTGLATVNVLNSTISGNSAATGAGSFNSGANSTINFNFSTITSNTAATLGGGTHQDSAGTTNLRNSIIGDNTAPIGPDISGTITSQDYNHVENTSGGTFSVLSGDVTGLDPDLGPLTNNGGTTLTHLPNVSSPVMNAIPTGTNGCGTTVTTSQNAVIRPQQTGCEKGATERLAPLSAPVYISGSVQTFYGQGIRRVLVTVSGGDLNEPITVTTGTFGCYRIEGLTSGQTYIVSISSKRYVFQNPTRVVTLNDNITDLDFIAEQ